MHYVEAKTVLTPQNGYMEVMKRSYIVKASESLTAAGMRIIMTLR